MTKMDSKYSERNTRRSEGVSALG